MKTNIYFIVSAFIIYYDLFCFVADFLLNFGIMISEAFIHFYSSLPCRKIFCPLVLYLYFHLEMKLSLISSDS